MGKSKSITHREMKFLLQSLSAQLQNTAGLIDITILEPRYDGGEAEYIKERLKDVKTALRLTKRCLKQYCKSNLHTLNEDTRDSDKEEEENEFACYEPEECSCSDPNAFCQVHNTYGDDE